MTSLKTGNNLAKAGAPTILVTRPQPGASVTGEKLAKAGFKVVVQPFTEMVAKPAPSDLSGLHNVTAIIVTSANALRYLSDDMRAALTSNRMLTVGDATREEAQRQGFDNVISADGNARDLTGLIRQEVTLDDRILYLCGAVRTPDIEAELSRLKLSFIVLETYETIKISQLTDIINTTFSESEINAVCFYSSVSAQLYAEYLQVTKSSSKLLNIKCFCISDRAKSCLPDALKNLSFVSEKPRDDAMIDLLVKHYRLS
jgi:uroporphyrinogen-III synthase